MELSTFQPITIPTIREQFIEQVANSILSGALAPGEKLPTEREIAEQMGISKGIVHLGLKDLERMGFVTTNPRHGTYISDYSRNGTIETLEQMLKCSGGQLDIKNTESLLEFRLAIELPAFQMFAERHDDDDLEALWQHVDRVRQCAEEEPFQLEDMAREMFLYHFELIYRSGNTIFPLVLNAFQQLSIPIWVNVIRIYGKEKSVEHVEAFTRFMEARDGDGASCYLSDATGKYMTHYKELRSSKLYL